MRKASFSLAPEGLPVIFLVSLVTLTFAALRSWPLALLGLVVTWFCLHFFRDPERVVPTEPHIAVSPADGKVIRIEKKICPISGNERTCISIFMNVFNVHVNRMPVSGTITNINYYPGAFLNAALDKASTDNERCAYLLQDDDNETWTMVQIAGLIARRIVCRIDEGDVLARGERFGMIRFGSRVDLYLPERYIPTVTLGEAVYSGESVLARKL